MAKGGFPRGMGGGGMMRQQAQMQQKILKMQKEIEAAQQKVEEALFTASVGGGAVKAVCSGKKELTELHISPDVLSPEDAEAVQDMVHAPFFRGSFKSVPMRRPKAAAGGVRRAASGADTSRQRIHTSNGRVPR